MSTVQASGTLTSTVTTEQTLATLTTDVGVVQPSIDCVNLVAPNYVIVKVKTKPLSGGVTRTEQVVVYSWLAASVAPVLVMDPIISNQEYVLTIQHNVSTSTAFPWKIMSP